MKGHHFNNEKGFRLFFNEIDDIYSIETTIDIRLSLNFTYFERQVVIAMWCTKHVDINTLCESPEI